MWALRKENTTAENVRQFDEILNPNSRIKTKEINRNEITTQFKLKTQWNIFFFTENLLVLFIINGNPKAGLKFFALYQSNSSRLDHILYVS
jgi:hypothetical protein